MKGKFFPLIALIPLIIAAFTILISIMSGKFTFFRAMQSVGKSGFEQKL